MNKITRFLVHFIFFYTCIEGLVINIKYPAILPYVFKDIVILSTYLLVFVLRPRKLFKPSSTISILTIPLFFFALITGIYLLGADFLVGLVALKQRLFYIPLISIGYLFIRSEDDPKHLITMNALYAIGAAIFGIYLYFRGPDALRQLGANYFTPTYTPMWKEGAASYWRVPGTFASPGQYGAYLQFNGLIVTSLLMTKPISKLHKFVARSSLILVIFAMFFSGSRATFLIFSASLTVLFLFSRKFSRGITWILIGYVIIASSFALLEPAVQTRFESIVASENIERFKTTYFGQLFLPALLENPLGLGLGAATIGTRHLMTPGAEIQLVESYLGIIAIETGIFGLLAFLWVVGTIGRLIFRLHRFIQRPSSRMIWYAMAIYVFSSILVLPVGTGLDAIPSNLYFWFSIGVLIRIADMERNNSWGVSDYSR